MGQLEQIRLAQCREDFAAFLSRIDIPGAAPICVREEERFLVAPRKLPAHHEAAARLINAAVRGDIQRFMVFWPPGTAKSTIISQCATAWAMGRRDDARVILTSYGTSLARKHSRKARAIARTPGYARIFDRGVSRETSAAGEWSTSGGAEMVACGLDAGVTGNRATLALFDDPFKGRKQAMSPTVRLRTREGLEDDLATRLLEDRSLGLKACMGGIFTRWVMDDPAAWFLGEDYDGRSGFIKGRDGMRWFVLNCPAQAEREDDPLGRKVGEYIWPERFSPEFWEPYKRVTRTWSSLYQQRPAPTAGLMFKREWFAGKIIKPADAPQLMTRVRGWDFASLTEEESADAAYSAAVKMGRSGERLFIGPVWRKRDSAAGIDTALDAITRRDGPGCIVAMPQDPGQAGKDQAVRRARIAKAAGARDVRVSPEYGDKEYRADGLASAAELGNVFLIDDGTWDINAFLDELCDFPVGKYKDQVDAASRACNELLNRSMIQTASVGFG